MLDRLADFEAALTAHDAVLLPAPDVRSGQDKAVIGEMHCSRCGDSRKMEARVLYPPARPMSLPYGVPNSMPSDGPNYPPENITGERKRPPAHGLAGRLLAQRWTIASEPTVLCTLRCVQCEATYTALKYPGPQGPALLMASSIPGGLSTRFTPEPVAYYLDQGHMSRAMGANSAAIAMYRAALEQMLFEQGFKDGMLAQKITALEKAIAAGTAPPWARDLETEYLKVIRDLGNGAIHTNGGDVTKQANLDSNLVALVEATFVALLRIAYEIPVKRSADLADLQAKAKLLK